MVLLNTDNQDINVILDRIHENNGYCPCATDKNEETKCMCKDFREMKEGICKCGAFIKVAGS